MEKKSQLILNPINQADALAIRHQEVIRQISSSRLALYNLLEKIYPFEFDDFEVPSIVIRSPEKVLSLEDKKKKLEHLKESSEYKNAVEEEKNIKLQIVRTLTDFKNRILS